MRLTAIESVLNRNLAASSAARAICRRLDAKVLAVRVEGTPLSIYLAAHGEHLSLATTHEQPADATLAGTALSLLRLAGPTPESAFRAGAVHIEGDAEVAQAFSELLRQVSPEPEEELARLIGDVAAHQVGNAARTALGFARRATDTLALNIAEYLAEESRDVPSRTELEEFLLGVDTLRDDVERLDAKLARFESQSAR